MSSSSSSSDSDEELSKKLSSAVDKSLFKMFTNTKSREGITVDEQPKNVLKSQRYLELDDEQLSHDDIQVPESMRNFIAKKLSLIISQRIEFVDKINNDSKKIKKVKLSTLRLLKGFDPIQLTDNIPTIIRKQSKICVKHNRDEELSESDKIKCVTLTPEFILSKIEVKNWKNSKNSNRRLFKYKEHQNILHFIDADNEFSKLRRKNNWNESKIRNHR